MPMLLLSESQRVRLLFGSVDKLRFNNPPVSAIQMRFLAFLYRRQRAYLEYGHRNKEETNFPESFDNHTLPQKQGTALKASSDNDTSETTRAV